MSREFKVEALLTDRVSDDSGNQCQQQADRRLVAQAIYSPTNARIFCAASFGERLDTSSSNSLVPTKRKISSVSLIFRSMFVSVKFVFNPDPRPVPLRASQVLFRYTGE